MCYLLYNIYVFTYIYITYMCIYICYTKRAFGLRALRMTDAVKLHNPLASSLFLLIP